jgi:hypothetical protein
MAVTVADMSIASRSPIPERNLHNGQAKETNPRGVLWPRNSGERWLPGEPGDARLVPEMHA